MTTSDYPARTSVLLDTVHEHDHEHEHDVTHDADHNSYARPTVSDTTAGEARTTSDECPRRTNNPHRSRSV